MDFSPPGSSVPEVSQAIILEGMAFLSPGDLPYSGTEPESPAGQPDSFTSEPPGKPTQTGQKHIISDGVKTRTQIPLAQQPKYLLTIW